MFTAYLIYQFALLYFIPLGILIVIEYLIILPFANYLQSKNKFLSIIGLLIKIIAYIAAFFLFVVTIYCLKQYFLL